MVTATEIRKGIIGIETEAFGANPSEIDKVYQFRYRVVDLGDLIPSHTDTLMPNPNYPQELQPRLRDRAASRTQILSIAQNLNPRALLQDSGFIDTGPMIVGPDMVVESGNGRVLALRKASQDFPQRYEQYRRMLETVAERCGIDKDKLVQIRNPVLVRERLSKVDRVKFATEANVGAVMGMSPYEQALQDSRQLSPNIISTLQVGEEQTIGQALRMRGNDHIIKHFVGNIPETERATIADEKGNINQQGLDRLKLALFAKTYTGNAGKRLVRIFGESADPMVKSIENAMFASLPDMAKAESLIDAKQREGELSIAPDMAEVVDTYASLKATGLTIKDYLAQKAMFEERLNTFQKHLLEHMDDIARKPRLIRELLRDIAQRIVDAPAKGQISMLGMEPITKEAMVYGVINRQRTELDQPPIQITTTAPSREELEKPDTGRARSPEEVARGMGIGIAKDKGEIRGEPGLAPRTSAQVGLAGFGKEAAQVKAFEEFGTAPGTGGKRETLVDVEAMKAREAAKPLPGQIRLEEVKVGMPEKVTPVTPEVTKGSEVRMTRDVGSLKKGDIVTVKEVNEEGDVWLIKEISPKETTDFGWTRRESVEPLAIPKAEAVPKVKEPKLISRREPSKRVRIIEPKKEPVTSRDELERIHASRSNLSRSLDDSQLHSKVVEVDSPKTRIWIRDGGRMDIKGIDTPSRFKTPKIRNTKVKRKFKPREINLGAGIVRTKRRQHIKLR